MRRILGIVVCLSCLVGRAAAEDPPQKPLTPEATADAALAFDPPTDEAQFQTELRAATF